jgi:uncharacterized membrane protein YdjX (TVP38/TMEM64 family)
VGGPLHFLAGALPHTTIVAANTLMLLDLDVLDRMDRLEGCADAHHSAMRRPASIRYFAKRRCTMQDSLRSLGPLGPLALVATISIFECVPFFPTQPLALASGLLFGTTAGAGLNLVGTCCAAALAFTLSRTIGRGLAQRVIAAETKGETSGVAARLSDLQETIRQGSPMQQFTAILLLRLTPVVPFSASNYVLGVSSVGPGPFFAATFLGAFLPSSTLACLMLCRDNLE